MTAREIPASSGRPGPGEIRTASGACGPDPGDVDGVVAVDHRVGPELAQLLDEVVDERVVVVDDQHAGRHGGPIVPGAGAPAAGPPGPRHWLCSAMASTAKQGPGKAQKKGRSSGGRVTASAKGGAVGVRARSSPTGTRRRSTGARRSAPGGSAS